MHYDRCKVNLIRVPLSHLVQAFLKALFLQQLLLDVKVKLLCLDLRLAVLIYAGLNGVLLPACVVGLFLGYFEVDVLHHGLGVCVDLVVLGLSLEELVAVDDHAHCIVRSMELIGEPL